MKSMFKTIGASALALSLALCGCGDKKGGSDSGSKSEGESSGAPTRAAFKPMVGKDVKYAVGVNLDKEQAFKVVDACVVELVKVLKEEMSKSSEEFDEKDESELKEKVLEIREQVAACKEDPFKNAPEDLRALLDESGLRNPEIYWGVLALEDFKVMDGKPQFKGLSLSIAGKVDLEKLISALQGVVGSVLDFEKTMLEGERTWHVVSPDSRVARELRKAQIDPYVTSLDGQLLLVASSHEALAQQIRLYRKGEGKGGLLDGFSAAEGEFAHLHLSGVGDMLWQYTPSRMMNEVSSALENGKKILWGLKDLVVDVKVASGGVLWGSVQLGTASSKDADQLRTFAKKTLPLAATAPKVPACVKKMVEELEIGGEQDRFEIGNVNLFSLALGAFVPLATSAMLNANTSTMAINGRKLITGIIQANIERQGKLGPVWPRTNVDAASTDDIASHDSKSATDYFYALFDMKRYGGTEWEPNVDGELLSALWGAGVPGMSGQTLENRNIAWCIAANVTDETPDFVPVLITANFNPMLLLNKWDGQTNGSEKLPIGPASGAAKSMFGDKAVVIVRKSGAAEVIKARYLTYNTLYLRQSFDLTGMNPPIKWLTPHGVVKPRGYARLPGGAPSKEMLNWVAAFFAAKGRKEMSREMYQEVLKKDATNHQALMGLWRLSLQEGAVDEAKSYLERAVKAPTEGGESLRFDVALLHMMNNDLEGARLALQKISDLQPSLQVKALLAGVVLQQADMQKDPVKKQKILAEVENVILPNMEVLAESPRDFYMQMTRAHVLMRKGNDPETVKQARAALEVAWQSRPVVAVGGMVLDMDYRLLDRESAERHAKQILRLDENHTFANWVMGSIRMNEEKLPEAERYRPSASRRAERPRRAPPPQGELGGG